MQLRVPAASHDLAAPLRQRAHGAVHCAYQRASPNVHTAQERRVATQFSQVATHFSPAFRGAGRGRCRTAASVRIVAFREAEKIQDWRVKQMVELAHTYFIDFLSQGKVELAETLFDENILHKDVVWDPTHPTVGVQGMHHYLEDLRAAFPDFCVEIDQIATSDVHQIMVTYEGSATNLGEYHHHKPSHHTSNFSGVNLLKFNEDRSKITEIHVYRSAFAEDMHELGEREMHEEGGFRELRLARLVK